MSAKLNHYAAGIDCGSAFCKGALLKGALYSNADGGGNFAGAGTGITIEKLFTLPSGWNVRETSAKVLDMLFAALPAGTPPPAVVATGYGREQVEGRGKTITEISAHAAGAEFLCPGARTLVDIGGQDCKVITIEAGRVLEFQMNDKCAAGSGRFLETVAARLGANAGQAEDLLALGKSAVLNSTCVVFAESEITALIARGVSREAILGGVADAMAARIAAMAARLSINEPAVLSGGLSGSAGIARALSRTLGITVRTLENGAYSGAMGAALAGLWEGKNAG
ncbi:MAG: acyl-CoA dehydratase activase [Spirochaetaceae bacterium]|jgi:predicted CoA-substrate-specific enzyme activase|nr:acyl-CoA dehydratase activase [Spirochaetaceae bacterium]